MEVDDMSIVPGGAPQGGDAGASSGYPAWLRKRAADLRSRAAEGDGDAWTMIVEARADECEEIAAQIDEAERRASARPKGAPPMTAKAWAFYAGAFVGDLVLWPSLAYWMRDDWRLVFTCGAGYMGLGLVIFTGFWSALRESEPSAPPTVLAERVGRQEEG